MSLVSIWPTVVWGRQWPNGRSWRQRCTGPGQVYSGCTGPCTCRRGTGPPWVPSVYGPTMVILVISVNIRQYPSVREQLSIIPCFAHGHGRNTTAWPGTTVLHLSTTVYHGPVCSCPLRSMGVIPRFGPELHGMSITARMTKVPRSPTTYSRCPAASDPRIDNSGWD